MPRVKGWQLNFVSYASANLAALGLVAGDLTPVTTAQSTWGTAYPAHVSAQQNAQAATQTKKDARDAYVAEDIGASIHPHPATSETLAEAAEAMLGMGVHGGH